MTARKKVQAHTGRGYNMFAKNKETLVLPFHLGLLTGIRRDGRDTRRPGKERNQLVLKPLTVAC